MGFNVSMAMRLLDGVTPSYNAMTTASNRFGTTQNRVMTSANRNFSRFGNIAKGVIVGGGILSGINRIKSGIGGLASEWLGFDNASRFASAKWKEVTTGAMGYNAALALTKQTSLDVGGSTMFTAGQVAEAMDNQALSGFKLAQSQATIRDTARFATLAAMGLLEATEASTGALGAYGLKVENSTKLGKNMRVMLDQMTATFTTSRQNLAQLSAAVTTGGAAFVSSFLAKDKIKAMAEFSTATFAMAEGGIVAETAGMRMRNIMGRLAKPVGEAGDAMQALKIRVADAAGNFRPFLSILDDVRTGLSGKGLVERAAFIKTIFGERNITAMNLMLGKSKSALNDYYKSILNSSGRSEEQMRRVQGSMIQRLLLLKSAVTTKFFTAAESGASPMAQMVTDITIAINNFDMSKINRFIALGLPSAIILAKDAMSSFIPPLKTVGFLLGALATIVIKMSPLIGPMIDLWIKWKMANIAFAISMGAVTLAYGIWNSTLMVGLRLARLEMMQSGFLAGAKYALATAQGVLNATMWASPITWIVAGLIGLGFVIFQIVKHWDFLSGAIVKAWDAMKGFTVTYAKLIAGFVAGSSIFKGFAEGGIIGGIRAIGGAMVKFMLTPMALFIKGVDFLLAKMGKIEAGSLSGRFDSLVDSLAQQTAGVNLGAAQRGAIGRSAANNAEAGVSPTGQPYFDPFSVPAPNQSEINFVESRGGGGGELNGNITISNGTNNEVEANFGGGIMATQAMGLN